MYIIGDFTDREYFKDCGMLTLKTSVAREDLVKAREDESWQIIDIGNLTYYNPVENEWIKIDWEKV